MGWCYVIKRVGGNQHVTVTSYLRHDGKFYAYSHEAALKFASREDAERKAFEIVVRHPEFVGQLSVVRSPYGEDREDRRRSD